MEGSESVIRTGNSDVVMAQNGNSKTQRMIDLSTLLMT